MMIVHADELEEAFAPVGQCFEEAVEIVDTVKSVGTDTLAIWRLPFGWVPFAALAALVGLVIYALK